MPANRGPLVLLLGGTPESSRVGREHASFVPQALSEELNSINVELPLVPIDDIRQQGAVPHG